jgi:hypothetical protein
MFKRSSQGYKQGQKKLLEKQASLLYTSAYRLKKETNYAA